MVSCVTYTVLLDQVGFRMSPSLNRLEQSISQREFAPANERASFTDENEKLATQTFHPHLLRRKMRASQVLAKQGKSSKLAKQGKSLLMTIPTTRRVISLTPAIFQQEKSVPQQQNCPQCGEATTGGTHWQCPTCTLCNKSGRSACEVCGTPAPVGGGAAKSTGSTGSSSGQSQMRNGFVRRLNQDGSIDWRYVPELSRLPDANHLHASSHIASMPYADKKAAFMRRLDAKRVPWADGHQKVRVRRGRLLLDAVSEFERIGSIASSASSSSGRSVWFQKFRFQFVGEPAQDVGGVEREWFELVSEELFDSGFGLFKYSDIDNITYQINPASSFLFPIGGAKVGGAKVGGALAHPLAVGTVVEARWKRKMHWYTGKVTRVTMLLTNPFYSIAYDDGDVEDGVPHNLTRPLVWSRSCELGAGAGAGAGAGGDAGAVVGAGAGAAGAAAAAGVGGLSYVDLFRFVGRFIGKAIIDEILIKAALSRPLYKHVLGKPVSFR
jgi:hypothetical protein